MDQQGGALLGEGVYGCVFDAPLVCKGRSDRTFGKGQNGRTFGKGKGQRVGKLTDAISADVEFIFSKRLSTIPNATKYFLLSDSLCTPAPRAQQTEKDIKDCELFEKEDLTQVRQISMPFGGKPLVSIPITTKTIQIEPFVTHLLEAGALLLEAGFVHFDLHKGNVLVNQQKEFHIIDFGMMWDHAALTLELTPILYRSFNPRIKQEPPENSVLNGLLSGLSYDEVVRLVIDQKQEFQDLATILRVSKDGLEQTFRQFLKTSWAFEKRHWFSYFNLYWSKIDAWAIGVLILHVYKDLVFDPAFRRNYKVESVIRNLCSLDAARRYDCAEALAEFAPQSSMLERPGLVAWLRDAKTHREGLERFLQ